MPMKLMITQDRKGPTLKVNLAVTCEDGNSNISETSAISETLEIDGLAKVRFKVATDRHGYSHATYISMMKHELALAEATTVLMNVTCDEFKYSKKWICSENFTEWKRMGEKQGFNIFEIGYMFLSLIEISISVYNVTTPVFTNLHDELDLTDFHLKTQEGSVAVHRAVLAVHSDMFKTMFTGEWKETKENLIEIKGSTLQTVQHLKDFIYLGTLPDDGLRPLLALALLYSMKHLKKECIRKLAETVLPEDLHSLYELACENNLTELICAITQRTPNTVLHQSHEIIKKAEKTNPVEEDKNVLKE